MKALPGTRRSTLARQQPLYRRVGLALVAMLALLFGALPAAAPAFAGPEDYQLTAVSPADPMHVPVLMYRQRHTVLQEEVSWERNVAVFNFSTNGVEMVAVGPSIGMFPNNTKVALIDLYRQDPATGQWTLVDVNGNPLTVNGKAVDWKTSSAPSVAWDLGQETDPQLKKELKSGLHSERVIAFYLQLKLNGAHRTTRKGLSERIPCESPNNQCRLNLAEHTWFPELEDMRYVTNKPSKKAVAKLKKEGKAPTTNPANGPADAETQLENWSKTWAQVGAPTGSDARARMTAQAFATPGSPTAQGAAANALAPGSDLGGIDFSTLELRYLAEGSGGKLQYAFDASTAGATVRNLADGQTAAVQASDAFFVWLSLPESTFWVNLNPTEPDRIVDAKLGTTDVGRILLQADFQMKKLVGRLIHPDTDLGKQFWGSMDTSGENCIDMRQWIVPAPATVYEQNGGLYIVDAPLQVKMETDYLKQQGGGSSCVTPDARMETTFRSLVLPKVADAVNHAPEFTELRRVYLSRVAAEWYRERHSVGGNLSNMINSGNVTAWPALQQWSPRQVFDQYVNSYQKKEFNITKRVTRGDTIYQETYTYGGVDFSNVVLDKAPDALFQHDHPDLPGTVQKSLQQPAIDQHGKVWLGATSHPVVQGAADNHTSKPASLAPVAWLLGGVCLLGVLFLVGVIVIVVLVASRKPRQVPTR